MKKLFISVMVLLSLPLIAIVLFFSTGGIFGDCSEEIISSVKSPDGKIDAVMFTKDCGATTAIATHVVLSQNDNGEQKPVFVAENEKPIDLMWVDANTLRIIIDEQDRGAVFKQESALYGIKIMYAIKGSGSL